MAPTITGFDYQRVAAADGVSLNVAVGGSGTPVVLLHGFPQTHLMWRHVATDLAADHTVMPRPARLRRQRQARRRRPRHLLQADHGT